LAKAIKEGEATSSQMVVELASVCEELDNNAFILEKNMEELVLEPISSSYPSKKSRRETSVDPERKRRGEAEGIE